MRETPLAGRLDTLAILAQNIAIRRSVLPLPYPVHTAWAKGLGLKRGGKTVIYTGQMYQMLPYLRRLQERRAKIPEKLSRLARMINPLINLSYMAALGGVSSKERIRCNAILRRMVALLRAAGVEPGYLYERDLYAGALAHDLGLEEVFIRHAHRVARALREAGVARVICVDPHTAELLRDVYPQVVRGFRMEVVHWLQVVAEGLRGQASPVEGSLALHDSCILARRLGIVDQPRHLLSMAGWEVTAPRLSGPVTQCCGGPAETLFQERAEALARDRLEQFQGHQGPVVTACPICLLNLGKAGNGEARREVRDLAEMMAL